MAVQEAERGIILPRLSIKTARENLDDLRVDFFVNSADRLISRASMDFVQDAERTYIEAMDAGYTRVLDPGHLTQLDALAAVIMGEHLDWLERVNRVANPTRGSVLTLAKSVETGHQGPLLQKGLARMKPIFERHGTQAFEFVRDADIAKFGLDPKVNTESRLAIQNAISNRRGIIIFPEGSVEAGRRLSREIYQSTKNTFRNKGDDFILKMKDLGLIEEPVNGLQQFDGRQLRAIETMIRRKRGKAAFVPIMIDGVYRLVRPADEIDEANRRERNNGHLPQDGVTVFEDKNIVTPRGKAAAVASLFVPTNVGNVRLRVGKTITSDDIQKELGKNFSDEDLGNFIGAHTAALYPKELQGIY